MLLGGKRVFPITLSGGPPMGTKDSVTGSDGWTEVAQAGVTMLRVYPHWDAATAAQQINDMKTQLAAAEQKGLRLWVGLYNVANDLSKQALLEQIVSGLKDSPGLGAWKGADEPLWGSLDPAGLAAAHDFIRSLDPNHPVVIIQAPKAPAKPKLLGKPLTLAPLKPYAAAGDIQGVDIYPISYPPGVHAGRPNTDISVVGDVTALVVQAAPAAEHWTTLQIAWSGILPSKGNIPIFPTLRQERFMAYQAIIAGAQGLVFFGGDLVEVADPNDKSAGWNWAFWHSVLKRVVQELTSDSVGPALVAPPAPFKVKANASDVRLVARKAGRFLYLIVVRRNPRANGPVRFTGLPQSIKFGAAMFEYAGKDFRTFRVSRGSFTDPFAPHDARVYRFRLG